MNFFLIGIYLSLFQIELFTAFLWLVECSVLFVFLLLLFYLNVKGSYNYVYYTGYVCLFILFFMFYLLLINCYADTDVNPNLNLFFIIENYYESTYNPVMNDLLGFSISYYYINAVEFILIGFLLLVGSVICVNMYQLNKNIRAQSLSNFLLSFDFFTDFTNFLFLRRQNLTKQGNTKPALKFFKK
jgi:hypothetical protein